MGTEQALQILTQSACDKAQRMYDNVMNAYSAELQAFSERIASRTI